MHIMKRCREYDKDNMDTDVVNALKPLVSAEEYDINTII